MTELPAGSELDALIATKVMGITGGYIDPNEGYMRPIDLRMLPYQHFSPSMSIAHAWEVVEKVTSGGDDFELSYCAKTKLWCAFYIYECYNANTAPLAICHAILEAAND